MKDGLKEKLLNTAQKIAENLYQKRIVNDDGINWVYKTKGLHSRTPQFKPLNESVYDGETGIAYFFFHASKIFNNRDYFELAQKILIECAKEFTYEFQNNFDYESNQRFKYKVAVSGYHYPLCLLHLMDQAEALFPEKKVWDETLASSFLQWINRNLKYDLDPDLLSGLAGAICTLLNIYERKGDIRFLNTAIKCADSIVDQAIVTDTYAYWLSNPEKPHEDLNYAIDSFAFGSTGIAMSLARIFQITHQNKYFELLNRARSFKHELEFANVVKESKVFLSDFEYKYSWGNGETGKIFGNLLTDYFLNIQNTQANKIDIDEFFNKALGNTDGLIFGNMGNLEIFKLLGISKGDDTIDTKVDNYLGQIIDKYNKNGLFNFGIENPMIGFLGLFIGEAGIGYQMLRFASWETVPSILALESTLLNIKPLHTKL